MFSTDYGILASDVRVGDLLPRDAGDYRVHSTRRVGNFVIIQSTRVVERGHGRVRTSVLHADDLVAVR